ncbi:MAG TPA: chemotaxis protein CheW [Clostridia bacterium]|nr:chemotaxis protein CheW [Clostridia bacterium]
MKEQSNAPAPSGLQVKAKDYHLVVFGLAKEDYAVDVTMVREIVTLQNISRVPRAPAFVEGVISLRGKIIPVIDLRKRLGLEAGELTKESRIIVAEEEEDNTIGMIVNNVKEVLRVPADAVEPASPVISSAGAKFIRGVANLGNRVIIVLDLLKVLSREESSAMMESIDDEVSLEHASGPAQ